MYLIVFFSFIVVCYFFASTRATQIIISLFLVSLIFSLLLGNSLDFYSFEAASYALFVSFVLLPMFLAFNGLSHHRVSLEKTSINKIILLKAVVFFSFVGFVFNVLIFSKSIAYFISSGVDIEVYKNGGVGDELIKNISSFLVVPSIILTPFAYLSLPLHFYFIINNRYWLSIFSFVGSLNIILEQIITFGRGGMVAYFFSYLFMLSFIYKKMDLKFKKTYRKFLLLIAFIFIGVFLFIAFNRFDNDKHYSASGVIDNPVIISIFDYYSQWIKNGYQLFVGFDDEKIIFMSSFMYLPARIMEFFGAEKYDLGQVRMEAMGVESTYFNGLPSLILYDLHYVGAILFAVFYYCLFKLVVGRRRIYQWQHYISIEFFILIPCFFFQGPIFVFSSYNIAIIYFIIVALIYKLRINHLP